MLIMYYFKRCMLINGLSMTFVLLLPIKINCQELQYEYTIEVPKYLCDKKQNLEAGVTTIRLLGKDAQKLKYDWSVYFKNVDSCKHQQRCTLMAWKAVRDLEKHLQKAGASQEIKINNTILVPGMQYILNVTVADNGTKVESKEFLFECTNTTVAAGTTNTTNDTTTQSEETKQASLILLGTNITYRDMIYTLNAEATNCDNYYFKWEILDNSQNIVIKEPTKGSELQILSDFLTVTERYTIRCSLMNSQNSTTITMASQEVQVLQRGMVLSLGIVALTIGPKQPFKLSAYFNDVDNMDGKVNIEWTCFDSTQVSCAGFKTINATTIESTGLAAIGRYNVTITVTKGANTQTDGCDIQVVENGFAKIEIDDIDESLDPSMEIDIPVYVSALITSCTLQWMSVKASNYQYLDLQRVPGNINALTNVTVKEDEFLNEIDEFSNNTEDIEYNLKIPPPKGDWKGLEANASYLFRLNVTCPIVQANSDEEEGDESTEPLLKQNYVTLTADIRLHTDAPPSLNSLEVTPTQGIAHKTLFYFQTNETDRNINYPVLYKFGYFLNNEIIFVSSLLGVTNTKSVLPHVDKGVKTVLEGCNSHSLCAQVLGPVVLTDLPNITDNEQRNLKDQLNELINREEYYKTFTYSLAILQTYSSIDEDLSRNMQSFIMNLTLTEIKRLLKQSSEDKSEWRVPANDLIKNVGILLDAFSDTEELLNNVVSLRNKLSKKIDFKFLVEEINPKYMGRKLLMVDEPKNRVKRQNDKITLDEVRRYLVISELIITTSPDKNKVRQEKRNMLNQIDKFFQQLCTNLYEKSQTINLELKTLILSIEKVSKSNFNRYLHILYDTNNWKVNGRIKLGKCLAEKLVGNRMCIGKVVLKNYLNKDGLSYMIKVYNADKNVESKLQDGACDVLIVLPIDEKQVETKEVKCVFWKKHWNQSQCKVLQVTAKTIQCACNDLGYYSLEYDNLPAIATTEITTTAAPERVIGIASVETSTPTTTAAVKLALTTARATTAIIKSDITTPASLLVNDASTKTHIKPKQSTKITIGVLDTEIILSTPDELLSTDTSFIPTYAPQEEDETILYCIIGFSLAGIGVLLYCIKYLLSKDQDVPTDDFPKYALLHHPEMLQDLPSN